MAKPSSSDISISDETIEMLEAEVKKGRPRKFFLVYKGAAPKTLVVFRKGPFGSKIMQAKKEGYVGDVAYGIVVGSGKDLTFYLAGTGAVADAMKVDSFQDKAPLKDAKFKEYLKKNGLVFKPSFEVVFDTADLPTLEGETEEQPTAAPAAGEQEAAPAAESGGDKNEQVRNKLMQVLSALTPQIKQAVAADPASKATILRPAAEIKGLIESGDFTAAASKLKEYKAILAGPGPAAADGAEATPDLLPVWNKAKEAVDQQLERFRVALLNTGDPYLTKIASAGVESFVAGPGGEYVSLQKSLFDLKNASGEARKKAAESLLVAVQSYRRYAADNQFIKVCDANKLCGPLSIGATLDQALSEIEQSASGLAA